MTLFHQTEHCPALRITGVEPGDEIAGARRLQLCTTRGNIPIIVHAGETPGRAVLCISGAIGGYDGPGMLYARLGLELPRLGITVARLNYRMPNEFGECVLDTMAGLTFLRGLQYERAALIGHSFGGAVAINAGTLAQMVTTVVAISSQLAGAHVVAELAPRSVAAAAWHGRHDFVARMLASALRTRAETSHAQALPRRRPSLYPGGRRTARNRPRLATHASLSAAHPPQLPARRGVWIALPCIYSV
jgi:pimeloyl-ACP methyl ester carboxylesterase